MGLVRASMAACLLMLSSALAALEPPSSPTDKNITVKQLAEKMRQCLLFAEPGVLQAFENKGVRLDREIKRLCDQGERNKAQSKAYDFATEIYKSSSISTFRVCGKIRPELDSELRQIMKRYHVSALRYTHACEQINP
ncbi:MAG: hypothetical protein JKY93_09070 [Gammaproteobacteria bacterium]|nr:hypothetical protein [Gammaproteobacteria bacterium]